MAALSDFTPAQILILDNLFDHIPELGKPAGLANPKLGTVIQQLIDETDQGVILDDLNARLGAAAADITAIKAIAAAARFDGEAIVNLTDSAVWVFDAQSAAAGDDVTVLAPAAGTGRWLLTASPSGAPGFGAAGVSTVSKGLVLSVNKGTDILALPVSGLKIGAGAGTAMTASAAELNVNTGVVAGAVSASKTVVADANKSLDVLQATTSMSVGGTGVPGAAAVQQTVTKNVTAFLDTTAKAIFTATIPNAVHACRIEVDVEAALGAGGAIGAGESTMATKYIVTLARTAGKAVVAGVSAVVGAANAKVAGADDITSAVVTTGNIVGAAGAQQTIDILLAITRSGAGATNHTACVAAKVLNQNATGVTIA